MRSTERAWTIRRKGAGLERKVEMVGEVRFRMVSPMDTKSMEEMMMGILSAWMADNDVWESSSNVMVPRR